MAELVAFGASVIAFIQLADRVVSLSKFYLEALDDCPHDIKTILVEITSLKALLETLNFLIGAKPDADNSSSLLARLASQDGPIEGCRQAVELLEKELPPQVRAPAQKRQKTQDMLRLLAWPLRQSKATKLLAEISRYKESIALAITTDTSRDLKDIKANLSAIQQTLTQDQHRDFCKWIEHTNPTRRHNESYELHEHHTGAWVTRSPVWNAWVQGLQRFLWIHGIPGAGKTVLTSFLVQEAKRVGQTGRRPVIYYYCHFARNQDEAKPLLRWLMGQLCRQSGTVPEEIMNLFKINHEPSVPQLLDALELALREFDHIYFVIDAVDESFPRAMLIRVIRDLATDERFQKVRLLVTSRQYIDIETTFSPIAVAVPMENELVAEDIKVYAHNTLNSYSEFADWPQDLLVEVEGALVAGAKGMFRWAFCQIDALRWLRPHEARKAIQCLPKTLDETYERIFLSIRDEDYAIVHTTLSVIYAHGSLDINGPDLALTVLLELLAPLLRGLESDSSHQSLSLAHLRRVSGCLLKISTSSDYGDIDVVEIAHYTVKEYLLSDRMAQGPAYRFSLCESSARREYCRLVLLIACHAKGWSKEYSEDHVAHPGSVCVALVLGGLLRDCEDHAVEDQHLRNLYRTVLDPSLPSWEILKLSTNSFSYGTVLVPYVEPPGTPDAAAFANFVSACLYSLAGDLLQSRNMNDILYHTLIHTQIFKDATWTSNIMDFYREWPDAFTCDCDDMHDRFKEILEIVIKQRDATAALCEYLAFHEHYNHGPSADGCRIGEWLDRGADPDGEGYRLTPLQIAICRLDWNAVEELLELGATANLVGDPAGINVLNGHFDAIPATMRPLTLVRNLRNHSIELPNISAERMAKAELIEEELLENGATEGHSNEEEENGSDEKGNTNSWEEEEDSDLEA